MKKSTIVKMIETLRFPTSKSKGMTINDPEKEDQNNMPFSRKK